MPTSWVLKPQAFTLIEMIMVIIILGFLASLAIPNFNKSRDRAHERDMIVQLRMLHEANKMYYSQNEQYLPTGTADATEVNNGLGLNMILNGTTLNYVGNAGLCYEANMTYGGFTVAVDESSNQPCCKAGTCPGSTLVACNMGNCP